MKKIFTILLCCGIFFSFVGCGVKENAQNNDISSQAEKKEEFDITKIPERKEECVELGKYKGLEVDKSSNEYKEAYEATILNDLSTNGLYNTESVKSGKVKNRDIANIDYVGKKDGVAFERGSAEGYELIIGSNSFIPGFEDGLIGKKIGSTVDLNLTFPKDYHSADLAGAKVVFTVTINSVKRAKTPEEFYKTLGFDSVKKYYAEVENRTIEQMLLQPVLNNSKITQYPKETEEYLYNWYYYTMSNNIQAQYGMQLTDYLAQVGMTEEQLEQNIMTQTVTPFMREQLVWDAIFIKEKMSISDDEMNAKIKELMAQSGITDLSKEEVLKSYGEYNIKSMIVCDKVYEFIKENAEIS